MADSTLPALTPAGTLTGAELVYVVQGGADRRTTAAAIAALAAAGTGSAYTLPPGTATVLGGVKPDGTTLTNTAGAISVAYGTAANTAAAGNDTRITGAATAVNLASEVATARAAEVAASGLAIASGSVSGTTLTLTRTNAGTVAITGLPSGGSSTTPVTTVATSGASQTIAFPASDNAAFDITQTANCTITLTGGTAGQLQTVTLILRQNVTAGWTATLPTGVKWSGGVAPAVNTLAGHIDVFTLSTPDAGTTVFGAY
jgi:hypothetical protein